MSDINSGIEMYRSDPNAVLVDLRDRADYEAGHIDGARNIQLSNLREEIRKIAKFNTPIYLYCYTGLRSEQAAAQLKARGYTNAVNIGGIDGYKGELRGPEMTIRELRLSRGLSQAAFARAIGVSQPTVAAYETGRANPGKRFIARIRAVYSVNVAQTKKKQGKKKTVAEVNTPAPEEMKDPENVRELRKLRQLSQVAFAESIGVSVGSVRAYESGRVQPSDAVMDRIKEVYGVDLPRKKKAARRGNAAAAKTKGTAARGMRKGDIVTISLQDGRTVSVNELLKRIKKADEIVIRLEDNLVEWTVGEEKFSDRIWPEEN